MSGSRFITLTFLLLTFQAQARATVVQQSPPPPAPTGLALEVFYYRGRPPSFEQVKASGSRGRGTWFGLFRRIPSWEPPAGSLPTRAVNLVSHVEGDAVRLMVSVFQGVRLHEREEPVATYLLRENQKVSVDELKRFGVEPFEIKVVRVPPILGNPPAVVSKVASIAAIRVEAKDSTLPSYKVSVQNLSSRGVVALGVEVHVDGRRRLSSLPQGEEGQALIEGGAVYDLHALSASDAQRASGGYVPGSSPNQEVVIAAAVFDDGTFEGDPETVARFRAFAVGRRIQIGQLIPLLKDALHSTETNATAALEALRAKLSALGNEADPAAVSDLSDSFPTLSQQSKANLKLGVEVGMNGVKVNLLKDLHELKTSGERASDVRAFKSWLRVNIERYEKWLSKL